MNYTDTQLKSLLAKMLPDILFFDHRKYYLGGTVSGEEDIICWKDRHDCDDVLDTELLHLVQLVRTSKRFTSTLSCDATWQEQVIEML